MESQKNSGLTEPDGEKPGLAPFHEILPEIDILWISIEIFLNFYTKFPENTGIF